MVEIRISTDDSMTNEYNESTTKFVSATFQSERENGRDMPDKSAILELQNV